MARQHRVNFEDLKTRADFRTVLTHYDLTIIGHGEQAKVHCPFHDDERPSCSVNLAKGLWQCFAGCGAGNVLEFVHRMECRDSATVSLRQAGIRLAEICGLSTGAHSGARKSTDEPRSVEAERGSSTSLRRKPRRGSQEPRSEVAAKETASPLPDGHNGAVGRSERPQAASPRETTTTRNKTLGFRLTLDPDHPYLASRGVPPELVTLFGLGFCAHGSMAGRLCIPIENANGELVAYAGRWAGAESEIPEGEEKYKLPAGFHKTLELWNLHRVRHCRHLFVVEGFFGAMRLHGLRLPAVALMGSHLSDQQIALLQECPTLRHITVLLDGDEPGRKAADLVAARLARHWWVRTLSLPDDTQPDTLEVGELERLLGRTQA